MLILLYVVLAIYLLTFSVTFFLHRHSRQGQRIAGVRPLMIAAAILLLGLAIAKATFSFIGAAYLFFALLVAAPLFAFGLGRLLATALTWLRRFRVVFALVVFLAASAPIASVAFLEYIRFQHHQALQAKLLAFQLGNLKVTFDNRKIVLPVNPRLALFPTCFDRHSSLKEGCRFSGHGEAATDLTAAPLISRRTSFSMCTSSLCRVSLNVRRLITMIAWKPAIHGSGVNAGVTRWPRPGAS